MITAVVLTGHHRIAVKIILAAFQVMKLQEAIKHCPEKFGESWLACLLTMVQGDITALTIKHAFVASKTGLIMATAYLFSRLFANRQSVYLDILLTGVLTALADLIVHPTHFGPFYAEAVATGIGAAFLAAVLHLITQK
jgi:uncharacterized integral membrane protein